MGAQRLVCHDCSCVLDTPEWSMLGDPMCTGCAQRRELQTEILMGSENLMCGPAATGMWLRRLFSAHRSRR